MSVQLGQPNLLGKITENTNPQEKKAIKVQSVKTNKLLGEHESASYQVAVDWWGDGSRFLRPITGV